MKSFVRVEARTSGDKDRKTITLKPSFLSSGRDLMKRGGKFYAIYDEETKMWSTNEDDIAVIIDRKIIEKRNSMVTGEPLKNGDYIDESGNIIKVSLMDVSSSGVLRDFNSWLNNLPTNHNYKPLDDKLIFKSQEVKPEDHVSKKLPYDMSTSPCPSYDELMSVLYDEENRKKLEWAIGSIFAGDSVKIEKMVVLYGPPGSGKSTVLDIIKSLFKGYWALFKASDLVDRSKQFSAASLRDNPLVAIQDDGSMSRIDDPIINEIISHKEIWVNEKYKEQYSMKSKAMLFMATNDPVDLNDSMGGMNRRILDVYPTCDKIPVGKYRKLVSDIEFELGMIANHCLEVYRSMGREYYLHYSPDTMIKKTNYIYNFIFENIEELSHPSNQVISRNHLFDMYKAYAESSNIRYVPTAIKFGEQIIDYYDDFRSTYRMDDGQVCRNVFINFRFDKFQEKELEKKVSEVQEDYIWLVMDQTRSRLDRIAKDWPAQDTVIDKDTGQTRPRRKWANNTNTLKDIDTTKEHYAMMPLNYISLDFDFTDPITGEKSAEINIKEASKYPATYAEFSKSGGGVHLYYIYEGDVNELANRISDHIEIKHGTTDKRCAIRRKLTLCNNLDVATISSGLPLKEKKTVAVNEYHVQNEKHLRIMIEKNLRKEYHGATKPSIDFIYKILEDAYASGIPYDVTDMRNRILTFANNSTHQAELCIKTVNKMKFTSEVELEGVKDSPDKPIVFFDCEVFSNFFCICYKTPGPDSKVVRLINPLSSDVYKLINSTRLIGFNNKGYDNHILFAKAYYNYSNEALYRLSQSLVSKDNKKDRDRRTGFSQAINISYTDIYDFASAGHKMSLKKWEIELGINHVENIHPWDKPLDEKYWDEVADYCANDVIATEAVFNHLQSDFIAREILADLSGLTLNDSTNRHTIRIIVGDAKNPQKDFVYTDLSKMFPGYVYDCGKSYYRGEIASEGGFVHVEEGCYTDVALLDVASMHPSSITALNLFGPYTKNFNELKDARLAIKHKEYDKVKKMFGGKLAKYLDDEEKIKQLPNALKTAINSVYGMTHSKFPFPLTDPRNKDNIVAKRGALFMIDLLYAVQEKGFTVAHIKTDSIKIPNATPEIIDFVMEFGKKYGYTFEHEATYKRMCIVNKSTYIALYPDGHWTAVDDQFAEPYVFKSLFTHEELTLEDLQQIKNCNTALYLDFNENLPEGEHDYRFIGKVGSFCPVKPGCNGGLLLRYPKEEDIAREGTVKYSYAVGAKGYRWKETAVIKELGLKNEIDMTMFEKHLDDAIAAINKYTDYKWFIDPNSNNELVPFPVGN